MSAARDKPPVLPKNGRRVSAVSLSPRKTRKALNPSISTPVRAKEKSSSARPNFGVALSKNETVLVTGTGDVLVCRCRYTSKAYNARSHANGELNNHSDDPHAEFWSDCHAVCNPCVGRSPRTSQAKGGLLGGAPPDVLVEPTRENGGVAELTNNSVESPPEKDENEENKTTSAPREEEKEEQAQQALEKASSNDSEMDDLAVLPSFDYSHFAGEGNDMAPASSKEMECIQEEMQELTIQEKQQAKPQVQVSTPHLMHGIPRFLPSFHQIKITQVSANSLGSHVLLISAEALLFSFGLNNHGQLGHGYQTTVKSPTKGFVTAPSLVTPLLENGGKAVVCSAGVDYSLVVVKTEGRRIGRLQETKRDHSAPHRRGHSETQLPIDMTRVASLPSRIQTQSDELEVQSSDDSVESMCHHQLYGFGRNDGRKLGLVDPSKRKKAEDVLVPRRVALNCNVWPGTEGSDVDLPQAGIFAVAASAHHSAALVHRASGAIELYTWGDAMSHALGPVEQVSKSSRKGQNPRTNGRFTPLPMAVTVPTVVKELSHSVSGQSANGQGVIPVQVALGPTSTFVITSKGKVLSFGKSDIGLLGQGHGVVMTDKPGQIMFPSSGGRAETRISSVSVGPSHAVAVASNGRVYAWGKNDDGKMGFDSVLTNYLSRGTRSSRKEQLSSNLDDIEWIPREVELPTTEPAVPKKKWIRRMSVDTAVKNKVIKSPVGPPPLSGGQGKDGVIRACAGYDMSVFVKESGEVLSCGTSSGRLGLGETGATSVTTPTPMFGGLRLWR